MCYLIIVIILQYITSLLTLLDFDLCVSSLRRGHANLLCIVPILTDDPRRESKLNNRYDITVYYIILCYVLVCRVMLCYIVIDSGVPGYAAAWATRRHPNGEIELYYYHVVWLLSRLCCHRSVAL